MFRFKKIVFFLSVFFLLLKKELIKIQGKFFRLSKFQFQSANKSNHFILFS